MTRKFIKSKTRNKFRKSKGRRTRNKSKRIRGGMFLASTAAKLALSAAKKAASDPKLQGALSKIPKLKKNPLNTISNVSSYGIQGAKKFASLGIQGAKKVGSKIKENEDANPNSVGPLLKLFKFSVSSLFITPLYLATVLANIPLNSINNLSFRRLNTLETDAIGVQLYKYLFEGYKKGDQQELEKMITKDNVEPAAGLDKTIVTKCLKCKNTPSVIEKIADKGLTGVSKGISQGVSDRVSSLPKKVDKLAIGLTNTIAGKKTTESKVEPPKPKVGGYVNTVGIIKDMIGIIGKEDKAEMNLKEMKYAIESLKENNEGRIKELEGIINLIIDPVLLIKFLIIFNTLQGLDEGMCSKYKVPEKYNTEINYISNPFRIVQYGDDKLDYLKSFAAHFRGNVCYLDKKCQTDECKNCNITENLKSIYDSYMRILSKSLMGKKNNLKPIIEIIFNILKGIKRDKEIKIIEIKDEKQYTKNYYPYHENLKYKYYTNDYKDVTIKNYINIMEHIDQENEKIKTENDKIDKENKRLEKLNQEIMKFNKDSEYTTIPNDINIINETTLKKNVIIKQIIYINKNPKIKEYISQINSLKNKSDILSNQLKDLQSKLKDEKKIGDLKKKIKELDTPSIVLENKDDQEDILNFTSINTENDNTEKDNNTKRGNNKSLKENEETIKNQNKKTEDNKEEGIEKEIRTNDLKYEILEEHKDKLKKDFYGIFKEISCKYELRKKVSVRLYDLLKAKTKKEIENINSKLN